MTSPTLTIAASAKNATKKYGKDE
ncbi:MAG: hypothetical protein RLZ67_1033, partial [Actinomycetota bacterium]